MAVTTPANPSDADASCNVLLVFPRFNPNSFWALTDTCRIIGAKAPAPPLGLMTLAALLPQTWSFRLVNRNTEELRDADLAWAEVVMTGGMLRQFADTGAVIGLCKERSVPVCVGGPTQLRAPTPSRPRTFLCWARWRA